MTHEEAGRLITSYALGLSQAQDQDSLEAHIADCRLCRQQLAEDRMTAMRLRDTLHAAARPDRRRLAQLRPVAPVRNSNSLGLAQWQKRLAPAVIIFFLLFGGLGIGSLWPGDAAPGFLSTASATAATMSPTPTPSALARTALAPTDAQVEWTQPDSEPLAAQLYPQGQPTSLITPAPLAASTQDGTTQSTDQMD